jgi:hypothetical protein
VVAESKQIYSRLQERQLCPEWFVSVGGCSRTFVNGVNVDRLFEIVDFIKSSLEIAQFKFRIHNEWVEAGHNRSTVIQFYGPVPRPRTRSLSYLFRSRLRRTALMICVRGEQILLSTPRFGQHAACVEIGPAFIYCWRRSGYS